MILVVVTATYTLCAASAAIHVDATGGVSVEPGGDLNTGSTLDVTR